MCGAFVIKFFLFFSILVFSLSSFSSENYWDYQHKPAEYITPEASLIREHIAEQLLKSPETYVEKAIDPQISEFLNFKSVIFHYGQVVIYPDKYRPFEIESLLAIMNKGEFIENGVRHDVRGVEWVFMPTLDYRHLNERIPKQIFESHFSGKIVGGFPSRVVRTYTFKRRTFPKVEEYQEREMQLLQDQIGKEINRITESKIGTTPGIEPSKPLMLSAPTCARLFF